LSRRPVDSQFYRACGAPFARVPSAKTVRRTSELPAPSYHLKARFLHTCCWNTKHMSRDGAPLQLSSNSPSAWPLRLPKDTQHHAHMAEIDSSKENGSLQTRRTSASHSLQQKEKMFFLQELWDWNWFGGLSDENSKPPEPHNNSEIIEEPGDTNTRATPVLTSSDTGPPQNFEVKTMNSDSSLGMPHITSNSPFPSGPSLGTKSGLPPARIELQRPLSPSSQIRTFQAENPRNLLSNYSGPMDRFLLQEDHSAGLGEDNERTKEEGRRLRSLRTNALRLRAQLKIKRKELREKQAAKTSADEAFIRHVRENRSLIRDSNGQTLAGEVPDAYYVAMQMARDEYGPLEDEYTLIEDILDETEFEMVKIEIRLYGPGLPPQEADESATISSLPHVGHLLTTPGPASSSFLGLSTGYPDQYEPIHAEYLSRLGDLDLAKERYQNMTQEHESLLLEQESRARVGMELNANLKTFLAILPAREAALQGEMMEIEVDVERLRSQCLEAGIDLDEPSDGSESEFHMEIEVNGPEYLQEAALCPEENKES
jgi:hypothetical protein